jgi:proteasome assembly chaperone 4
MNVQLKRLEASDPSLPSLVLQVTQLVDTYMLWIGIADGDSDTEKAVLRGHLCNDWACAMPPRVVCFPHA